MQTLKNVRDRILAAYFTIIDLQLLIQLPEPEILPASSYPLNSTQNNMFRRKAIDYDFAQFSYVYWGFSLVTWTNRTGIVAGTSPLFWTIF